MYDQKDKSIFMFTSQRKPINNTTESFSSFEELYENKDKQIQSLQYLLKNQKQNNEKLRNVNKSNS